MCGGGSFFNEYIWSNPFVNPAAAVVPSLRENWSETVSDMNIPDIVKPIVNIGPDPITHNAGGMADAASTFMKGGSIDQAIMESGDHDAMLGEPVHSAQSVAPSFTKKVGPYAAAIGGAIASALNPAFSPFIAAGTSAIGNQLAHDPSYYETRNEPNSSYYTDTRQLATKAAGTALALQGIAKLFSGINASGEDLASSVDNVSTAQEAGNIAGSDAISSSGEGLSTAGEMEGISDMARGVGERATSEGIDLTTRAPITAGQYDTIYGGLSPSDSIIGNVQGIPVDIDAIKAMYSPVTNTELTNLSTAIQDKEYIDSIYNESVNHPNAMYTVEGPNINPYAEADVDSLYNDIRPAPSNPGLDYPILDKSTGLPKYSNDMYDYWIDPETGERVYSDEVINSTPAYDTRTVDELYGDPYNVLDDNVEGNNSDLLNKLLKAALRGFGSVGGEEGTPGYRNSWWGGSGLDMNEPGYFPNRNKGRRDLGMNMLKGTDLDLEKFIGPYLEDYVLSGR